MADGKEDQVILRIKDGEDTAIPSGAIGDETNRESDDGPQEEGEFVSLVPGDGGEYDDSESGEREYSGPEINGEEGNEVMIIELRDLVPGRESGDADCGQETDDSDGEEESDDSDTEASSTSGDTTLLFEAIEYEDYHEVQGMLTAKALMEYKENALLLAIKVIEKLHDRAGRNEQEKAEFIDLANRVEEFTLRLLDPLKHDSYARESFSSKPETDIILETAIKLEQKKFFDHPIIIGLMTKKWYGGQNYLNSTKPLWLLLLNIWCLFDFLLFPLPFFLAFVLGRYKQYKKHFMIPYIIFLRDTQSYLILLGLHFAICFEPSQLPFSGLEWAILVFMTGRLFTEITQFEEMAKKRTESEKRSRLKALCNYLGDRWNIFDIVILVIFFFVIFPLRIFTWALTESVKNNRALDIAEYLYGFNTMLLTFRAFGSILETFEGVGTIQIALFRIIRDVAVVVLHFFAVSLAFSGTITKLFVAETPSNRMCNGTGIVCWWKITTQLGWSLLDLSDGLDFFKAEDSFTETLAHLLYAAYLVVALILLINMLIALLSNTYQRVEDNSRKEWAFKKAITIQTYCNYNPIPVPHNIISIVAMKIYECFRRKGEDKNYKKQNSELDVTGLVYKYRIKYGNYFPDTDKLDQVFDDAEDTKSMVNQVLYKSFTNKEGCHLPTGPKAWPNHDEAITIVDNLLTCKPPSSKVCGAVYNTPFSSRFPHFEIMILESGEKKLLGMGVMFGDEDKDRLPSGWKKGSVGYYIDWMAVCVVRDDGVMGRAITTDPAAIRRGDVVRCTVRFEDKQEKDGKVQVPVEFTLNGSRIYQGDDVNIEHTPDKPLFVYPYIDFQGKTTTMAKMSSRADFDHQGLQLQEVKSDLEAQLAQVKSELAEVKSQLVEVNRSLEKKLDVVLAKLSGNE